MAANVRQRGNRLEWISEHKSCSVTTVLHTDVKESKGMREATGVILENPPFFGQSRSSAVQECFIYIYLYIHVFLFCVTSCVGLSSLWFSPTWCVNVCKKGLISTIVFVSSTFLASVFSLRTVSSGEKRNWSCSSGPLSISSVHSQQLLTGEILFTYVPGLKKTAVCSYGYCELL